MEARDLFRLALQRDPHGGEHPDLQALREYTHQEMLAGRIDGATQDHIGELLDDLSTAMDVCVGDFIGPRGPIPWDVLEVESMVDGTRWRRLFGEDRMYHGQEYDWTTTGGHMTTDGVLHYAPLKVLKVVQRPADKPDNELVRALKYTLGAQWTRPHGLPASEIAKRMRGIGLASVDQDQVEKAMEWLRREGVAVRVSTTHWSIRTQDGQWP